MVDRRRSDEYKSLTVYLPNELVTRIKQYVEDTSLPQSELVEQAVNFYFDDLSQRKPENIAQLVGMNMGKLKEVGFKHSNLSVIARGELLPTRPDCCEILTKIADARRADPVSCDLLISVLHVDATDIAES